MRPILLTVWAVLLASCAAVNFDLPPVGDGKATLPGKFVWHDLISDDPAGSEAFYGELFGWSFRSLPVGDGGYWIIEHNDAPIGGMVAQDRLPASRDVSQWVSAIAVNDADEAVAQARRRGAEILREPVSLGRRGTIAVIADPTGGLFAALGTHGADPLDTDDLPPVGNFLWHELWSGTPDEAAEFYADMTGLTVDAGDPRGDGDQVVQFHTLRDQGRARGGVRTKPDAAMPTLWMPYLRVGDSAALAAMLERVPALGGQVLVPAIARPIGGELAIIAGPSGAPIGLQTWSEDQPSMKEI